MIIQTVFSHKKWEMGGKSRVHFKIVTYAFSIELRVCGSVIKCFFVLLIYLKQPKIKKN